MKREYVKPFAEKIEFDYQNQIVAASGNHECQGVRKDNYTMCRDVIIWTD